MLKATAQTAESISSSAGVSGTDSPIRASSSAAGRLLGRGAAATVFSMVGLAFAVWIDHLLFGSLPLRSASVHLFSSAAFVGLVLLPVLLPLQLVGQAVMDACSASVRRWTWCLAAGMFVFATTELLFSLLIWAVYPGAPVDRSHKLAYASGIPFCALLGFVAGRRLYSRPIPGGGPFLAGAGYCLMFHCIIAWLPPVFPSGTSSHLFHNGAAAGLLVSVFTLAGLVAHRTQTPLPRRMRLVVLLVGVAVLVLGLRYPFAFRDEYAVRDVAARAGRLSRSFARHTRYLLYPRSHGLQHLGARSVPAGREAFEAGGMVPDDLLPRLAATKPRNILLLTVDALRIDATQATPGAGWGRLAREGVAFLGHQSAAPGTRESLATLFTGRPHFAAEVRTQPSLVRTLREVGFFTLAVGYAGDDKPYLDNEIVAASFETVVPRPEPSEKPFASALTDALLAHLRHPSDRPFFAWAHYLDPHAPYEGKGWPRDRYLAEVAATGREVDRLLDGLSGRRILNQTLVVLTADHGEEFGEHAGAHHNLTLYQEILHVPLIVRAPGGRVRGQVTGRTSAQDLFGAIERVVRGSRAQPSEPAPFTRGDVFSFTAIQASGAHPVGMAAVVRGRFKLIYELRLRTAELYDLESDPTETTNLVDDRPDVAAALARSLRAEMARHGAIVS